MEVDKINNFLAEQDGDFIRQELQQYEKDMLIELYVDASEHD